MTTKPALPQNDPNQDARQKWLAENRSLYNYNHDHLPPLAMLDEVPDGEKFTFKYIAKRGIATIALLENMRQVAKKAKKVFDPFDELQDFEDLFPVLPKPSSLENWRTDNSFAEQRLAGANPMKLRKVTNVDQIPFKFPGVMPGYDVTVQDAISAERLFLSDYRDLSFISGGNHLNRQKFLPSPVALFYWSEKHLDSALRQLMGFSGHGELLPVAIQLKSGADVFTPSTAATEQEWLLAKLCVQIADANHHEMSSHLCRTHFVMAPFAIATARQLAQNHPLGVLLRPHFRFMLDNNEKGRTSLINPGGPVDKLLAGTLDESLQIVTNSFNEWSVNEFAFPREIENRGLADPDVLKHFPYRDDGMLLWNAIKEFVGKYIQLYYATDEAIGQDQELQAWAGELKSAEHGRVKDMPARIESRDALTQLVTTVIFTCGPQHGAVNFSQYDYMAFTPNMPLAAYCPVSAPNVVTSDAQLMEFLPPLDQTKDQLKVMATLTAYHYDRLGFYDDGDFDDQAAVGLINEFQKRLIEIEAQIEERNKKRNIPYKFMLPSQILNSISI